MVANKKPKIRTETVGVRLPPKLRYGLVLVARKNGLTLSEAMMRALEAYLENDGIAAKPKEQGAMLSSLDKLWSESEAQRLLRLAEYAPELATHDERRRAEMLIQSGIIEGPEADQLLRELDIRSAEVLEDARVLGGAGFEFHVAQTLTQHHPRLLDKFGSVENVLQWLREGGSK